MTTPGSDETRPALQALMDRQAVIDVINALFVSTDRRDWGAVRGCLAPIVLLDMTSLAGGEPAQVTAEQVASGWEAGLRPIEAVHHQVGNYRVEVSGAEAQAFCYGVAYHYRRTRSGRNTRMFVGSYDVHLVRHEDGWHIDRFQFNAKFVEGNLELEKEEPA